MGTQIDAKARRKKYFKIYTCLMLAFVVFGLTFSLSYTGGRNKAVLVATPVTSSLSAPQKDVFGYQSFQMSHQDFKILQISDVHYGNGFTTKQKDKKALQAIQDLVDATTPNFIVLTGDVVYPVPFQTGTRNNLKALKMVAEFMEGLCVPWTMVFGNHDAEQVATNSKSELCDYLETLDYCIFERGKKEAWGEGNTFVNLYSSDSLAMSLALFDASATKNNMQILGYEPISTSQTDWFEKETKRMGKPSTMAFWHIPENVFSIAWQKHLAGSDSVEYHFGNANEKISSPTETGTIFNKMVELGNTKAIFAGHNHKNDFSLTYKGIRLTCAKSIDYLAYLGIAKKTQQRGATLVEVGSDGHFDVEHILLSSIQAGNDE